MEKKIFTLQLVILILAPIWVLKVVHYFIYPITYIFDSPSLILVKQEMMTWQKIDYFQTLFNILLFGLFFIQHIIMATLSFKINMKKLIPNYPIYQRLIYNIISSILLYIILENQNPQSYKVFQIPYFICYPIIFIALGLFIDANQRMPGSLLFKYSFIKLLTQKQYLSEIKQQNYDQVLNNGITIIGAYNWIRHPMQSGFLMLIIFGNNIFTFQKIVVCVFMILSVLIGVKMEQIRLIKRYTQYKSYMNQVKQRFIPFII